jgi:ribonuclease P protein component
MAIGRMDRIKSSAQISEVFNLGTRFSSGVIRIIVLRRDQQRDPRGRVAFIAGTRLGNAVVRNRSKRVMREAARAVGLPAEGCDVLLMATPRTRDAGADVLVAELARLLKKAGIQ